LEKSLNRVTRGIWCIKAEAALLRAGVPLRGPAIKKFIRFDALLLVSIVVRDYIQNNIQLVAPGVA
jgi:hypothetical protein